MGVAEVTWTHLPLPPPMSTILSGLRPLEPSPPVPPSPLSRLLTDAAAETNNLSLSLARGAYYINII
jgi:hypothetical protein